MERADVKLLKKYGFSPHEVEVGKDQLMKTNWPTPVHCYRLVQESWKHSIEEALKSAEIAREEMVREEEVFQ